MSGMHDASKYINRHQTYLGLHRISFPHTGYKSVQNVSKYLLDTILAATPVVLLTLLRLRALCAHVSSTVLTLHSNDFRLTKSLIKEGQQTVECRVSVDPIYSLLIVTVG